MIEIKQEEKLVKVTIYSWACPGCGIEQRSQCSPQDYELLCDPCEIAEYDRCKREFRQKFIEANQNLLGASILDVAYSACFYHYDSNPETVEVSRIVVGRGDKKYLLRAEDGYFSVQETDLEGFDE